MSPLGENATDDTLWSWPCIVFIHSKVWLNSHNLIDMSALQDTEKVTRSGYEILFLIESNAEPASQMQNQQLTDLKLLWPNNRLPLRLFVRTERAA